MIPNYLIISKGVIVRCSDIVREVKDGEFREDA